MPLPILSGEGAEAIPDFTRLMIEANKRAAMGLMAEGSGLKTLDEISDKLDPYGKPTIEADVEGEVLLAQQEEPPAADAVGEAGPGQEEESEEDEEIVERMLGLSGLGDDGDGESVEDEDYMRVKADEDVVEERRFDPVLQENWQSLIRWGTEDKDEELEETELSYARWNGHATGRRRPLVTKRVQVDEEEEEESLENGISEEGEVSEGEDDDDDEEELQKSPNGNAVDPVKTAEDLLSNGALAVQGSDLVRHQWVPYIAWDDRRWRRLWRGLVGHWDPRRFDMDHEDPYITQEAPPLPKPNLEALGLTGSGANRSREAEVMGKKTFTYVSITWDIERSLLLLPFYVNRNCLLCLLFQHPHNGACRECCST